MPSLLVKEIGSDLLREVNYAASGCGMTQREWVLQVLRYAVEEKAGVKHGESKEAGVQVRETEKLGNDSVVSKAQVLRAKRGTGQTKDDHPALSKAPEPAARVAKSIQLATKYDGTPDTCPRCRVQLEVVSGSKTQCPKCKEHYKRLV